MAAKINDDDGGDPSSTSIDGIINLACRGGSRADQLSIVCVCLCVCVRAWETKIPDTPGLKIGAAHPESMEARPPLTCWEPGSTS